MQIYLGHDHVAERSLTLTVHFVRGAPPCSDWPKVVGYMSEVFKLPWQTWFPCMGELRRKGSEKVPRNNKLAGEVH